MACCVSGAAAAAAGETGAEAARAAEFRFAAAETSSGAGFVQFAAPSVHCGACIAAIEKRLRDEPGVIAARVNLSTRRISAEYRKDAADPARIAAAVESLGYQVHPIDGDAAGEDADAAQMRDLAMRMAVAGFAAANVMLLSVSVWSGAEGATRDLMHWLSALIVLPVAVFSGKPFYSAAFAAAKHGRMVMETPISLAVILAVAVSLIETVNGGAEAYFDAAATLLFLLLIGRFLDRMMRARARSAVTQLLRLAPRGAQVIGPDGLAAWRPAAEIAAGDLLLVSPGERLAVDGIVAEGASDLDRAMITGESAPDAVRVGDRVEAGAMNLTGALRVRAAAGADSSTLAEILRLMEAAEQGRSRVMRIADQAARIYAPVVHIAAAAAFMGWLASGASLREALLAAIATLIITCPCALGLAAPIAQVTASGALFRRGVMVRDGSALERLAQADAACFDKTGVLTMGRPEPAPDNPPISPEAAALAQASLHPMSRALFAAAQAQGVAPAEVVDIVETPGFGLSGRYQGAEIRLGRADYVGADDDGAPGAAVWFARDGAAGPAYRFVDSLRPEAAAAIEALRGAGLAPHILSGDRAAAVEQTAAALGVEDWRAGLTPAGKIAAIQSMSGRPLMVGDGINDAPALTAAHVSMAPAAASDIGRAAADLVFFHDGLGAVPLALSMARATQRVIRQNFAIAAAYNLVAAPLAMLGHATPLIAAVAMSTSSILVVANALRLNHVAARFSLKGAPR